VTHRPIAEALARALRRAADTARTVIGAPDYARYLRHVRAKHPGQEPLSRDAFTRDALARRYERLGSRCC
jgi:uncharacterized short protein YbdD (DUF466 family)